MRDAATLYLIYLPKTCGCVARESLPLKDHAEVLGPFRLLAYLITVLPHDAATYFNFSRVI